MIKSQILNMIFHRKPAIQIVLPKYDHDIHHEYGIGPMLGWESLNWYPRDDEETFNKNWDNQKTRDILIQCGWTKTSIKYNSNRQGFRMNVDLNEVVPGICDFYLGCSMTFGIGVNLEDTWQIKMSNRLGILGLNFGIPGGSIESQYRVLRCWAPILKPRRVYTLGTYLGRRELLEDNVPLNIGSPARGWKNFAEDPRSELYWKSEIQISHIRAYDAIRSVCRDYSIELYSIADNKRQIFSELNGKREGRDLIHPGRIWHSEISNLPNDYWERLA